MVLQKQMLNCPFWKRTEIVKHTPPLERSILTFGFNIHFMSKINILYSERPNVSSDRYFHLVSVSSCPTCRRHLRDIGTVGTIGKSWLVVIDVLHLDDELRLWLQRDTCVHVNSLGSQGVEGLFLPVKYQVPHTLKIDVNISLTEAT